MLGFIRLAGSAGLPTGAARMAKYKAITTTTMKTLLARHGTVLSAVALALF